MGHINVWGGCNVHTGGVITFLYIKAHLNSHEYSKYQRTAIQKAQFYNYRLMLMLILPLLLMTLFNY